MTSDTNPVTVYVEAPARLHFGVLDLRGELGRWFGGIGAAAPMPTMQLSASRAEGFEVTGEDRGRAACYARRVMSYHGLSGGLRLAVDRALPAHVGLGSGTQLALSVARALAELYGLDTGAASLARAAGRGARSAIGTHLFDGGGLVVEGGRRRDADDVAPLLARIPFPPTWWCVVGVPAGESGVSGADEQEAFAALPPPERDVERVSHLVLMGLLPALADSDLRTFGQSLSAIQSITGRWFASIQGGTFASGPSADLVRMMAAWGVEGVGQSSWGPAVYGLVDGEETGRWLAGRVRSALGADGNVYSGAFRADGARVWHAEAGRLSRSGGDSYHSGAGSPDLAAEAEEGEVV